MKGITSFRKRLKNDSAFFEKYSSKQEPEQIVAMAQEDGYEITTDELLNSLEISPEELANVVGGIYDIGIGISGGYQDYSGIIG